MDDLMERSAQPRSDAGRPRPDQPVFFMHVAKTAGSFVNARLVAALGAGAVATHIESRIGNAEDVEAALASGVRVFSGHVMLGLWDAMTAQLGQPFRMVTVLRDPVEHLASHLHWLDSYAQPERRAEYRRLDEAHRRVVDRIGALDLTEIGQLDAFLTGLSGVEVRLFDNCQARYFLTAGRRDVESLRPLTLAERGALAAALARFDFIALQSDLASDLPRLGNAIGVALTGAGPRVNTARATRRIDVANPVVRQVLSKRTTLDQWLWRHVQAARRKEQSE